MNEAHELRDRLIQLANMELNKDIDQICTAQLGQVIDMIKDLAQAMYYSRNAEK